MKRLATVVLCLLAAVVQAEHPPLLALCYHDVVVDAEQAARDPNTVTVDNLVKQLAWLDSQGFQPITLDQWIAADDGGALPAKPVLLTFDDGYASFAEHVLPLLNLFDFPAVLAPVTSWIDAPPGSTVDYGGEQVPRERFLNWTQLRTIINSGRVEIASHSHDLHRGLVGNPFGNIQPAAVTRVWDAETRTYENETEHTARVAADLARSVQLIERNLGITPRIVVWPYGAYSGLSVDVAATLGLRYSMTLDAKANTAHLPTVHRLVVGSETSMREFALTLLGLNTPQPLRAAHIDLDYVYDPDPVQMARNLDRLLDRIQAMQLSAVFLQAFADEDGDGVASGLYFPNRHLPMRADLFNRVAWQLKTRANVNVFAWMPVLAFELPDSARNDALAVKSHDGSHTDRYHRLSPFHPDARRIIEDIYADLGASSQFAGVLFHDDGFLTDREDVSAAALKFYRENWNVEVESIETSANVVEQLAAHKTRYLIEFTHTLAERLRRYQPALLTARNLYARVLMEPASEAWFAQSFTLFQHSYDFTAVMAMPMMEGARNHRAWLGELLARVRAVPGAMERTLFELQSVDWRDQQPLSADVLAAQMDLLLDGGARHIAYYPDDFIKGHPPLELIRSRLSVNDYPTLKE